MPDPVPGTAVLVTDGSGSHLRPAVVLAGTEEGLSVIPVSAHVEMATEWDLVIDESVLGYRAIAEVWNYGTVLPEQVDEEIAPLPERTATAVQALFRAAHRGETAPEGAEVGPPVLNDADPRLLFQDEEGEALRVFWLPALALAGAGSLGEVVRHRRDELDLALDGLGDVPAAWVEDLEHDRLYLPWALAPAQLAAVFRHLRLGASARLGRLTRATLEMAQPALPRGATRPAHEETMDPDTYVAAFLTELDRSGGAQ